MTPEDTQMDIDATDGADVRPGSPGPGRRPRDSR